ncbi:protein arginine N-methyltransferase 7-like [Thrips palmi]|uniref:Protein arginine N-methyltransferase n=1 Tax=Thrips palmi TaxID=161013 RepID=A0A6P9A2X3_THRPL|nr:protein arginine N-methyltransferase 7-like [Thrips palmi]XP_034251101.1 protein arginine N-methyltransferase 7-like [Thrips palmi]XP_034251102.1 protein arginine N-methyltransferase 7-like [Thrips palmi]XP_034251103.1 protein arginine N-methyltransferase 7-like [Thrips palmi]XP_034251105.1 protein arginine N-methyltransferase 7-like [Thrips palmi]
MLSRLVCVFKPTPLPPQVLSMVRAMSVFSNKVNPITGKTEWEMHDDEYDFHQEIARSSYADMLHDTERNEMYQVALESAIKLMHQNGKPAHVLDIGTGTGLLAMMAARAGADSIIACEAFEPVGKCAKEIINLNGYGNKIKVIPKRSTALTVGPNCDLPHRANILVTEVFDTELIGEGAYATFSHAHKELLEKDCIVVPSSATVYAQVVESELVSRWHNMKPLKNGPDNIILTPPEVMQCKGAAAVHDIQLSQLSPHLFKTILPPVPVFRFDYSGRSPVVKERSTVQVLKAASDGIAQAVFMWWDLTMDTKGEVVLSCAPFWAHPSKAKSPNDIPWRDHWMQAVYYLPTPVTAKTGQELTLISSHDEYSLWFNLALDLKLKEEDYKSPVCSCSIHAVLSRSRIGQINDEERTQKYIKAMQSVINEDSVCLSVGDSFVIALAAAKLGAKKVLCIESCSLTRRIIEGYVVHNNLKDQVNVFDEAALTTDKILEKIDDKVNVVLSEPYQMTSILPWENLHFWYKKTEMLSKIHENCVTLPCQGLLYGMAVDFKDLWKIRAPLKNVQGFEMKCFDSLIDVASNRVDCKWEAQPLWEYPCKALSKPTKLLELNFNANIPQKQIEYTGSLDIMGLGQCNGVALWVDWVLDEEAQNVISTGPTEEVQIGHQVNWNLHSRQGVYLFPEAIAQVPNLTFTTVFNPTSGVISFDFKPVEVKVLQTA